MIAAQLLAYYFTELKDDQVKKVSRFCFLLPPHHHFLKDFVCTSETETDVKTKQRLRREKVTAEESMCCCRGHSVYSFYHHHNYAARQKFSCTAHVIWHISFQEVDRAHVLGAKC